MIILSDKFITLLNRLKFTPVINEKDSLIKIFEKYKGQLRLNIFKNGNDIKYTLIIDDQDVNGSRYNSETYESEEEIIDFLKINMKTEYRKSICEEVLNLPE